MAELKKRILNFENGRRIRLYGNSLAIGKSLEIGEGYAPNVFSYQSGQSGDKPQASVFNPYKLTKEELLELADYNIRLWMDLKDKIRKYGITNTKLFNKEAVL